MGKYFSNMSLEANKTESVAEEQCVYLFKLILFQLPCTFYVKLQSTQLKFNTHKSQHDFYYNQLSVAQFI